MGKINARKADALRQELQPLSARIDEIAGKHGLARSTIIRHLCLPIAIPALPDWNRRIAGR